MTLLCQLTEQVTCVVRATTDNDTSNSCANNWTYCKSSCEEIDPKCKGSADAKNDTDPQKDAEESALIAVYPGFE